MDAFWTEYLKVLALCGTEATKTVHWTTYVTAFTTPVLALLGVLIAHRQWATARDKLRLDLFERRLAVYDTVKKTLGRMVIYGRLTVDDGGDFRIGISGSRWLFGPEVQRLLEEIWERICDHQTYEVQLESKPAEPERSELIQKNRAIKLWFNAQLGQIDQLFMPYMSFPHRSSTEGVAKKCWQHIASKFKRQ